ncbi:MAG TPA: FtsX-like permease family protein, partial [Phycisphaerales bacterium]|nr:FtsX-like permease family protein [Phycisphaerales bacterium]
EKFSAITQTQLLGTIGTVLGALTGVLAAIAAISLLVGGVGVSNIMLVGVRERTREIGLRKAIGARPQVILVQFLVESVTLCLAGGAIGLAAGQGLIAAIRAIPESPLKDASVPVWAVLLAVGFSAGTGVVFGMFPAIKAARLDPIEALRHD